jgi:membrane protease YdiL (CAAX protease family)
MSKNKNRIPLSRRSRLLAILGCACAATGLAAETSVPGEFSEGGHQALVKRVNAAQAGEYQRVLGEFTAYLDQHPGDAIASVERCRFIDVYAYSENQEIEAAADDAEHCAESLRNGPHTDSGAVKVYLWQQTWGEDSLEEGESLLKESSSWTAPQRTLLHEGLSARYRQTDLMKSGAHALAAVKLDPRSNLRLNAAEYLVRLGAKRRAVQTIETMPADQWQAWTLQTALTTLLGMGDTAAARRLVETHTEVDLDPTTRLKLARALIDAGETEAGRALVVHLVDDSPLPEHYGTQLERELFAFQRDHGGVEDAVRAYRKLRDTGFRADAFGRHRLSLSLSHLTAPWRLADLVGVGGFLLLLAFAAVLPVLVIAPVHYRSAVRRAGGFIVPAPSHDSPWSLAQLWYALAAVLVGSSVTLYIFSYPEFEAAFGMLLGLDGWLESLSDDRNLGRAVLWGEILSFVLLLPLLRGTRLHTLLLGHWSVRRSVGAGVGIAFLFLIAAGITRLVLNASQAGLGLGTDTIRAMQGIHALYGPMALLGVMALLTPVVEELLFRGIFLRAAARHVSIWVAALAQAAVFTLWHEEVAAYPYLFAFALAAAWLAWRSGGLLAPITLHVVNNFLAALSILGLTRAINMAP